MARLRGRALRGQRLKASAPFGGWKTQTFIAGLRCFGLDAPWVIDGAIDRDAFDRYVETQLAPTLQRGDVVILDNLSVHKSPKAAECLKAKGAWSPVISSQTVEIAVFLMGCEVSGFASL